MFKFQFNFSKIFRTIAIVFLIAGFLTVSSNSSKTFAATGILKQINFQGKVVNANGTNVANGNYDFEFKIYTVATVGTAVWTETRTAGNQVAVTDGIFRVSLGSITALPGSVDFNTDNIYLGINFNSDGEMTPRVQFTSVPYAFNALKVAGLTVTDTTGTFTLTAAKTLTVNNTLTFAGTDSTTITFQGTDTYVGRATTDTLTNKTIGSTGLAFSGAATDVTTASNEDLTLAPNGTGNTILTSDFNSGVLVGSSTNTLAPLSVSGGIGSNALLILNQTNSGDVLAASASGATKFRIANNGDAVLSAGITLGATNGASNQCLLGGATAAWGSCAAGAGSNWDIVNGVITPKLTSTLDFLLGSAATGSAKFAVLNINSGTPTATISATTTGLSLSASGTIQSLQNATLTIGGNTTGTIILSPLSGSGTVSSTGDIDLSTGKVFRIAGASILSSTVLGSTVTSSSLQALGTISTGVWQGTAVGGGFGGTGIGTYATGDLLYAGSVNPTSLSKLAVGNSAQVLGVSAGVPAWIDPSTIGAIWQIINGSAQLKNTTLDLLVGATASTSAKFAVLNINSGTPTASVSAGTNGGAYITAAGILQTTANQTLTLGGDSTGNIILAPLNGSGTITFEKGAQDVILAVTAPATATRIYTIPDFGANDSFVGLAATQALTGKTYNGLTVNTTTGTLALTNAKTLTVNNTLAFSGTDASTLNIGAGGTLGSNAFTSTAYAPIASPTFTGTVTIPTPFTIGAVSMTSTGTQLNYLNGATGTTGTTTTNLVFSTSPTLVTPVLGAATATSVGFGTNNISISGTTISTSGNNADLTLTPNGSGNIVLTGDFDSQVLIGATSATTEFPLYINNSIGSNASLAINNINGADLFTASASGVAKFTVSNGGNITAGTYNGNTITTGTGSLTLGAAKTLTVSDSTTLGTNAITLAGGEVITFSATNALSLLTTGITSVTFPTSGTLLNSYNNWWQLGTGTIAPGNLTADILIGSTASSTAVLKFSPSGTSPVSSISARTSYAAEVVDNSGVGDLFTASSSGNTRFVIKQNGVVGIGSSNPTLAAGLQVTANYALTGDLVEIGNSSGVAPTVTGSNALQLDWFVKPASGAITASERINITNSNTGAGGRAPALRIIATGPGGAIASDTVGIRIDGLGSASNGTLTQNAIEIGANWDSSIFGEGDLRINSDSNIIIATNSAMNTKIGIGTASPLAGLDIRGIGPSFGTTAIASISGKTSFAALTVDNSGAGAIFTASSSGNTRFVINSNGGVGIGVATPSARLEVSYFAGATHAAMFTNRAQSANSRVLGLMGPSGVTNRWIDFMSLKGQVAGKVRGNATFTTVVYDTNGGDFAEWFKKKDLQEPIRLGDLICFSQDGFATKCTKDNTNIIGVFSDNAGFVGGGGHEEDPEYVLVGLVGQLHLNVSTENGEIRPGDSLTPSSATGVGAKATKAGRIVGKAIEGYSGVGIGKLLLLINPTYFTGISAAELFSGLESNQDNIAGLLLTQFISGKDQLVQSKALSEITTDRLVAGLEIITPKVTTDVLSVNTIRQATGNSVALELSKDGSFVIKNENGETAIKFDSLGNAFFKGQIQADSISANKIEGLEILTDKISSLQDQVAHSISSGQAGLSISKNATSSAVLAASVSTQIATGSANPRNDTFIQFESGKFNLDLTVLGKLNAQGALVVVGPAEFKEKTVFQSLAEFIGNVIFRGDVSFLGRPTFNKDTAGFAVIKKEADRVGIVFDKEYEKTPIVNASLTFDQTKLPDGTIEDPKILEKKIFDGGYQYVISQRTQKGFTITLNKKAVDDITFSWIALSVKDSKKFESAALIVTPTPTQVPIPTPTPQPTVASLITPSQEARLQLPSQSDGGQATGSAATN